MKRLTFLGAVLLLLMGSPPVLRTEVVRQSSVSAGDLEQHIGLLTTYCITRTRRDNFNQHETQRHRGTDMDRREIL